MYLCFDLMSRMRTYRAAAMVMAFLMFFTSMGYSVDLHYCKDELKSFSLFGKAESCHETMSKCPRHAQMQSSSKEEKGCCSNKLVIVDDLDADFDLNTQGVELSQFSDHVHEAPLQSDRLIAHKIHLAQFFHYNGPSPPRDIYALYERFII